MKQRSLIIGLLALGASMNAWAYEGKGSNPGDWKMMPSSLEKVQDQWNLRLRNLDLFPKYCTLRVTYQGEELIKDVSLLFKADRSVSLPLGINTQKTLSPDDLQTHVACIKVDDNETVEELPNPAKLSCQLGTDDCEHVCKAEAENPDRCENNHLVLEFSRSSYQVEETANQLKAQLKLSSHADETLTCQAVMTARVVGGGAGDVSGVVAGTDSFFIEPSQTLDQQWIFDKSEAGIGRHFDISRPRVAVLCTPGKVEKDSNWFKSCQPIKRSECNWLVIKD